jgi:hypothetical protein
MLVTEEPFPVTVGPFDHQHLAYEWGEKNIRSVEGRGWRTVQLLPRAEAATQLRRRRLRRFEDQ